MSTDDKVHFVGFTIAELTVIATALFKHQEQTDNFVGYRGATRFHTQALTKIKAYCDQLAKGDEPALADQHRRIVILAEHFIRAHCEVEALSKRIGLEAACASAINERVVSLHVQLEKEVLGDERLVGRRS